MAKQNNAMPVLCVPGWDKWQSYRKDRGTPPWIKIHRNLLSNSEWAVLTDAEKGQLISIWLVAADKGGRISGDPRTIRKICQLDEDPNISRFIELQFLAYESQPIDNQVTTSCQPSDALETETETETETEREKKKPRKKRAAQLPADWQLPDDYREYCEKTRTDLDPDKVAAVFLDYWRSTGKPMADWKATWRNWVRRDNGNGTRKDGNGNTKTNRQRTTPATRGKEALARKDNASSMAKDVGDLRGPVGT